MSIYERSLTHPCPYYDFLDKTDFGGVTLPHGNSFETTYTSNLFDDNKFGQSIMDWLAINRVGCVDIPSVWCGCFAHVVRMLSTCCADGMHHMCGGLTPLQYMKG